MNGRKAAVAASGLVLLAVAATTAGGHHGPHPDRAGGGSVLPAFVRPAVRPGVPGTATRTIYEFATAYARITRPSATERYRKLSALAAPPLLQALQNNAARAQLDTIRGLPPGTSITGRIVSLQFGAGHSGDREAAVVIDQQLMRAGRATAEPVQTAFVVRVIRVAGEWHVAQFRPIA
jgi:hypothetical protein